MRDYRQFIGVPKPGTKLGRADAIVEKKAGVYSFGTGAEVFEMFVLRHGGELYGYVNDCPHARSPLDWRPGEFLTPDKSKILCTMHGAEFDIKSGICGTTPCPGGELAKVPIELRDGVLYIAES